MVNNSIANYTITKPLGRGGMAEVYEAVDTKTQQNVALKLLLPHLAAEDVIRQRFLREAKVGMELDHPGIVRVFDVGEAEGRPYMAMELVQGQTLDGLLKTKIFDLEQCIGISLKITDALAVAHQQKIVHRDIKPRNIMVTDSGIKIMDFGLARILETSSITDQHEIIGTLYYMSPEQAIGIKVDESSDVFSLGVVLYQMLTGHLPFAGEHPGAVIHAILYSDPLRINELGKSIPLELEQIIFKTLKKKPQSRYRTAGELHADLFKMHDVLQGKPIQLLATEEVFEESPRGIYSQLVGRESEMAALEAALEKMLKGESSVILVSGEAGIGKSRLVWELGQKAKAKQVRYLLGRCLFGERGYPYQPIIEVLRDYFVLKGIKDQDTVDAFVEEKVKHLSARKEIIQSLLLLQPGQPITLINKEQLWDTISELVKVMAQDRPIVLHLDDLHWADAPTLNLLTYLAMTSRRDRLIIIGTYRPEELAVADGKQHPLEATRQLLSKENLFHELRLARLNKQGTHDVINSVFAESDFPENFYDSVHLETEGNPLFVLEVLNYLQNEGIVDKDETGWHLTGELTKLAKPDRVTDVITHRLTRLTPENRSFLDVAAVEGYTFQSDTLCHVLGEPRLKVLRHLQHLESQHHLVHALEHEYQFDHGKIQETLYSTLPPELKKEYHGRIADYFIKHYASKDQYAAKIAKHLINANQEKESLCYLLKAGKYAQSLHANEMALRYLNNGLDLVDKYFQQNEKMVFKQLKIDLLTAKVDVEILVGHSKEAKDDCVEALRLAQESDSQETLASSLNMLGKTLIQLADYGGAINCLNRAMVVAKKSNDRLTEWKSLHNLALIYNAMGNNREARKYLNQALVISRKFKNREQYTKTMSVLGNINFLLGNYRKSFHYFHDQLESSRIAENKREENFQLINLAGVYFCMRDRNNALFHYKMALEICRQIGYKELEGIVLMNIGNVFLDIDCDYDMALSYLTQALDIFKLTNDIRKMGIVLDHIGAVYQSQGKYEKALGFCNEALEILKQFNDIPSESETIMRLGQIYYDSADYVAALNYYQRALEIKRSLGEVEGVSLVLHLLYTFWRIFGHVGKIAKFHKEMSKIPTIKQTRGTRALFRIDEGLMKSLEGDYQNGLSRVLAGLRIARRDKETDAHLEGCTVAAEIEMALGKNDGARKYAENLAHLSTEKGKKGYLTKAHLLLSCLHLLDNDNSKALAYAKAAADSGKKCGMKEILWQAHHMLAKVYLRQKKPKQAKRELNKAKQVLDVIINNLGDELKKIYLRRKEVKEFKKDLRSINRKPAKRSGK